MKLPEIDLALVERRKRQNQRERLQFIEQYAAWLKKTPNKEWSRQQAALLNAYTSAKNPSTLTQLSSSRADKRAGRTRAVRSVQDLIK